VDKGWREGQGRKERDEGRKERDEGRKEKDEGRRGGVGCKGEMRELEGRG
jgi:hypothetical protein